MTRPSNSSGRHTRRSFLQRAAMVAGAGAVTPWVLDLAAMANVAAAGAAGPGADPYRALVCIFMYGGNDSYSTVIPTDAQSFSNYKKLRPALALDSGAILPLNSKQSNGRSVGLAPQLANMKNAYDDGDLAIVSNVGPLREPMSKAQFADVRMRPPQLFSHNDQESMWQSSEPEGSIEGWGGRLGDLVLEDNSPNGVFTCMSTAGSAVMMNGQNAVQYQVDPRGVTELWSPFSSGAVLDGLREVMSNDPGGMFGSTYSEMSRKALNSASTLSNALKRAPGDFPSSRLGAQLQMVSRLIAAGRDQLGLKRQVFFVGVGGYDTHADQGSVHPGLLLDLDASMAAFRRELTSLGASNDVTTFTASEFGRTLTPNRTGTDHGWGAHHFVMGGAVSGGRVFGELPEIGNDGPDDVGRGRLLPSISVDQYASTFASWMGISDSNLDDLVPRIQRFPTADLGFFSNQVSQGSGSRSGSGSGSGSGTQSGSRSGSGSQSGVGTGPGSGSSGGLKTAERRSLLGG